ncbi:HNH endonuclease [Polaribacter ponticola]|uniref:HNH endonuclease n=1 Tax=Polaribacter ponticola TaxID=2978475 RepID=A0ABT5S6R5_9FLAO|nr:hypothetical protein [Polaribacter sp. MSW5]MDD7913775.1 hypothetical protein [Polaribacter sp. MSW5]MDD7916053.1 hypothetical protein [Polaribacter sp. MSW5]
MKITINTSKCFECGEEATEDHHIIPRVYGGTKTIPLCSSCHMKVHGIKSNRRTDNHKENVKRGLDKGRIWELFSGWLIQKKYKCKDKFEFRKNYKNHFKEIFSNIKITGIFNRIKEIEDDFLESLFRNEINDTIILYFIDAKDFTLIDENINIIISKNLIANKNKFGSPKKITKETIKKGVKKRKHNSLIDRTNVENIRFIMKLKKKGKTFYEITKQMNEKGLKTRQGKDMNQVQVKRLYERFLKNNTKNS